MDRFTSMVVAGVLGLVVVGLATAAFFRTHEPTLDLTTPAGVVLAYAMAEQRNEPQAAWDLLAASAQARYDHDRFVALAGTRGRSDHEILSTEGEHTSGDSATVLLVRTYTSGGFFGGSSSTNTNTVTLTRQGPDWRITIPPANDYLLISKSSE